MQDRDRSSLIDHPPVPVRAYSTVSQRPCRRHRRQPLVGKPHRQRLHRGAQPLRERRRRFRGDTVLTPQRLRQTDDHLYCLVFRDDRDDPRDIRGVTARPWHGLDGRSENTVRIAGRHPDAHAADIDADPATPAGVALAWMIWLDPASSFTVVLAHAP